ncbi:beta/gamma crystallin-related protein [Shimazuella sp. AN120528]|uniref:beta/gamma crystallin-related protein n=1 Tax=Shimazuella soli TaxID=1892854 RepID=UPI001F0EFCDD|nr:beta/gamma crystallin-related protein [Shimazuella soli]MCH5584609.1 beta/gamma crystallin-related protein [Shimazuella soli]
MKKCFAMLFAFAVAIALIPVSAFAAHQKSCVTLYEHVNFKGKHIKICSNDSTLVNNNWNDIASSAKVSRGGGAVLYEHINYKGHQWNLAPGNYPDFTKRKLGNGTWNDVVSSVRVK